MAKRTIINPPEWKKPVGYSNGMLTEGGKMLFLGGQVAFDENARVVGEGDLVRQFRQVMTNIKAVCDAAGAKLEHIVKLTIFVKDKDDYIAKGREIGKIYREFFDRHYPAMTLVEISRFYEPGVLLEIEGIAVVDS